MKTLTYSSAISLLLLACQPAEKAATDSPKSSKSETIEKKESADSKSSERPSSGKPEAKIPDDKKTTDDKKAADDKKIEDEKKAAEDKKIEDEKKAAETKEPEKKKDGDALFSAAELEKVSYIKVYTYLGPDSTPAGWVYADLAAGKIGRSTPEVGKVMQRKAPLTKEEIATIRDAIAKIKVHVPESGECDNTMYQANFRADYKIDSKLNTIAAYAFHSCKKDKYDYVKVDALINLNGLPLRGPLGGDDKNYILINEPK